MAGRGRQPPRTPGPLTDFLLSAGYGHMTDAARAAKVSPKLLYDICNGQKPDCMRHSTIERIKAAGLWGLFSLGREAVTERSHIETVTESSGERKGKR